MEIGAEQREGWPKVFVLDGVEHIVHYNIREPTGRETYESCGYPMKPKWVASTVVNGTSFYASADSPVVSVIDLAQQVKKFVGSKSGRVLVELPLEPKRVRELSARDWIIYFKG